MGLLEHLSGGIKNNFGFKGESVSKANFGFNTSSLEQYNLKKDVFIHSSAQTNPTPLTSDDSLALKSPVKFIGRYLNKTTLDNAVKNNPNISRLLKEHGLECSYNIENVNSIIMSHLIPTANLAQKVYTKMGHSINEAEFLYLTQAALLHDIGKAFIPSEIINKRGKLSKKEREIIELHNKLSYEILKTTNLNPRVAQLAFEHHDYDNNLKRSHENQAITISDVYCALREKRPYKNPISDIGAKAILYDMGTKGKFDTRYISYINS